MATEIKMLPFKQQQITTVIKRSSLPLSDFNFQADNNDSFTLKYKPIKDFIFSVQNNSYALRPAQSGKPEAGGVINNWSNVLTFLDYWLGALKENIEIGNPWEEIENAKEQMNEMNFDSYEEVFTSEDQKNIEIKLNLLLSEITKLNIDTTIIKEDIKHMNEMSNKISKKDWKLLIIGLVASWGFTGLVPQAYATTIWESVKTLFADFKFKQLL